MDRAQLVDTLSGLTPPEFETLVTIVQPPSGVVPGDAAPQRKRAVDLLTWAESPTGRGLQAIEAALRQLQTTGPPITCPHNLPRSGTVEFVGREADLANLQAQLQQTDRLAITAIRGMGGIGKTELALQYARYHQQQGTYPGGICWLQARDQDVASQIVSFAKRLNLTVPEGELVEQVSHVWMHWPLSETVLVVLDDVADFGKVQPYLPPQTEQFRVLMTTRQTFSGIASLEINVLSPEAALALLKSLVGADRIEAQREAAKALGERLGYLPLALELVGRYLELDEDLSIADVQAELDDMQTDAYALVKDESAAMMTAKLGVAAAFELSLQRLTADSQTLATVFCLFAAAPIAWEWVQRCLPEVNPGALKQHQRTLLKNSLLQRVEANTYQLHPLIQEFLRKRFARAPSTEPLLRQYCRVMVEAAGPISYTQTLADVSTQTPLIPHLKEAVTIWPRFIADGDILTPANKIATFYYSQGAFHDAEDWLNLALSQTQDRLGDDHPDVATSLNNLAELYGSQGRYREAEPLHQQALALRKQLLGDDHPDIAQSLNNLAGLYRSQGRYSEAEPLYQQALALSKQRLGDDHPHVAASLNNLAGLYRLQGRYSEAEPLCYQALALRKQRLGDTHPDVAQSLNNLAGLFHSQGRYSEAEPLYHQALALWKQLLGDDHPDVATSLNNLAGLYRSQGRYSEAEPLCQQALALKKQLLGDDHPDVATSLNNLALLYDLQGHYSEAELLYQQALVLLKQHLGDDHPHVATSLNNLALLYADQGLYQQAKPLLEQALELRMRVLGPEHPHTQSTQRSLEILRGWMNS